MAATPEMGVTTTAAAMAQIVLERRDLLPVRPRQVDPPLVLHPSPRIHPTAEEEVEEEALKLRRRRVSKPRPKSKWKCITPIHTFSKLRRPPPMVEVAVMAAAAQGAANRGSTNPLPRTIITITTPVAVTA